MCCVFIHQPLADLGVFICVLVYIAGLHEAFVIEGGGVTITVWGEKMKDGKIEILLD